MNWLLLTLYSFSPADSCARMATLAEIPEEAVLFAELAAREGGEGSLLFGRMLELAGRFGEASDVYGIARASATDPLTEQWLTDRMNGSLPLDTILVLRARVTNSGNSAARGLLLVMPRPSSHAPYQQIELLGGAFRVDSSVLVCRVDSLAPGGTISLPVFLHISQQPFSFRPICAQLGDFSLSALAAILNGVAIPAEYDGSGPCLQMSRDVREEAGAAGLSLGVVGGLVRRGNGLVFHAWNLLEEAIPGMPVDPLLFKTDSLRAFGHCPTDVIPLWSLLDTEGHELSIFFPEQDADISISLEAFFADFQPEALGVPNLGGSANAPIPLSPELEWKGASP